MAIVHPVVWKADLLPLNCIEPAVASSSTLTVVLVIPNIISLPSSDIVESAIVSASVNLANLLALPVPSINELPQTLESTVLFLTTPLSSIRIESVVPAARPL